MTNLLTADGCTVYEFAHARMIKGDWDCWTTLRDEIVRQARAKWERELAEVRRQAAWDALGEYCESEHSDEETSCRFEKVTCSIRRFRNTHYAPTPRSVTLSDGSVVTWSAKERRFVRDSARKEHTADNWIDIVYVTDTGADFDLLKAFVATVEAK